MKPKTINGVNVPHDMHGRAFPFKEREGQWLGPASIDDKIYRMMVWLNKSQDGRSYLRVSFEEPVEGEL